MSTAMTLERQSQVYRSAYVGMSHELSDTPFLYQYRLYAHAKWLQERGRSLDGFTVEEKARILIIYRNLVTCYFIAAPTVGMVKIGKTINLKKRLSALQTSCPVPLEIATSADYDDNLEARVHEYLAEYRSHGEWFFTTPEVIEFMRGARDEGVEWVVKRVGDAPDNWSDNLSHRRRPKDMQLDRDELRIACAKSFY